MNKLTPYYAFNWWRELKPSNKRSLSGKYYPESNYYLTDSNINRIEEMYTDLFTIKK